MSLDIRTLDRNEATIARMVEIGRACFGPAYSVEQLNANWANTGPDTRFFGVFETGRLVAFNGFLAHRAYRGGETLRLFQSCHSATDPQFRGQGMFSALIEHAHAHLDGHYLVGFPNSQSEPIFVGRLGYRRVGLKRIYLPVAAAGVFLQAGAIARAMADRALIHVDERAAAAWKQSEFPGRVLTFDDGANFLWGRRSMRRAGPVRFNTFRVGGCTVGEPARLPAFLRAAGRQFGISLVEFIAAETSPIVAGSRIALHGQDTEPWIWRPLPRASGEPRFDVHNGLKDAWSAP